MAARQLNRACHAAVQMAEMNIRVSLHTLRHSVARHLLEQNIDVRVQRKFSGLPVADSADALVAMVTEGTFSVGPGPGRCGAGRDGSNSSLPPGRSRPNTRTRVGVL
jgi:hypothetical protein